VSVRRELDAIELGVLQDLFHYHPPTDTQREKYEMIREVMHQAAVVVVAVCEPGPDQTAAINKLREAMMVANASIATRNIITKLPQ
jgi:hypothetical protein